MISIGIPAFKAKYLREAIESVLKQSYPDFELIIVNDASPENIDEIVHSFNDSRIRYFKNQENLGKESVVRNWNRCLEYARGEYFVLFSDDDVSEPNFLKEMEGLAEKHKSIDLFHCRVRQIDKNSKIITYSSVCPEFENVIDFIWHRVNGYRLQYVTDFFCRTSALRSIGGFYDLPLAWGSDDITWYKLAKDKGVIFSSEVLSNWRWSDINISSVGDIEQRIKASTRYYDYLESFIKSIIPSEKNECIYKDIVRSIPHKKNKSIENLIQNNLKNLSFFKLVQYKIRFKLSLFIILKVLLKKV
jgi:glycosyltransferase involved in cell wall biosynthesis